jgi:hypothetical protein
VLPSLPGYGFSGEPTELGWNVGRIGQAWAELMSRLGYTRYVAQGGDVVASVTDAMGRQAPQGLLGIHTNLLVTVLGSSMPEESGFHFWPFAPGEWPAVYSGSTLTGLVQNTC